MVSKLKNADYSKSFSLEKVDGISLKGAGEAVLKALDRVGFDLLKADGNIEVTALRQDSKKTTYIDKTRTVSDGKFVLEISKTEKGAAVNVYYAADKALFYALLSIEAMALETFFLRENRKIFRFSPCADLLRVFTANLGVLKNAWI
jgi:hypothetical protein